MPNRYYTKIIREKMQKLKTYNPSYDLAILELDHILCDLKALRKEMAANNEPHITQTEKGIPIINPHYKLLEQLRSSSLRYLDALGLTVKGNQRNQEKKSDPASISKFDAMLKLVK